MGRSFVDTLAPAALAVLLSVTCLACAGSPSRPGEAPRAGGDAEPRRTVDVRAHLETAAAAFGRGDAEAAERAVARAREIAGRDFDLQNEVAMQSAAFLVERGDLDGAGRLLMERIALAQRVDHPSEVNLHDRMLFLCEARGDRAGALLEAIEMRSAIERLPPPWSPRVRQGYYWQRAHTLLHYASMLEGRTKETALAYAEKARAEFAALARKSGHALQSIQLLDEEFQAASGDCTAALATARGLRVDDLDPQDLYTTATVFSRCGDATSAGQLFDRVARTTDLDLFSAVYRHMAKRAAR